MRLSDEEITLRRESVFRLLDAMEIIEPTRSVLSRAAQPLPTTLGTLDAIHLATALELESELEALVTYDKRLAQAAQAAGLTVESPA